MGLLHKNLILAGIASVAMVGFLGSSSASALDGFSISDIINQQQAQKEQLLSYLANPFAVSTDCEATNPESSISCNETPFPNLLFNGAPNNSTWGHEGKGLVFVNNNNLVEGNPQLATAKRGDTLKYAMEIETQRYNDAEMTKPAERYVVYALFSEGLILDQNSVVVKVGDQTINLDDTTFEYVNFDEEGGEQSKGMFGGASGAFACLLPWQDSEGNFLYGEDAVITVAYSATIDQNAPSEVWSRGAYTSDESSMDYSIFQSTEHQATALIDGNILIRRVDANGDPLAGAKYMVDGVRASVGDKASNFYVYDENGDISEFTTDNEGKVIIKGVPMGEYTVREIEAPTGHESMTPVITSSGYENTKEIEYGDQKYIFNYFGLYSIDITSLMGYKTLDDGRTIVGENDLNGAMGSQTGEPDYDECSLVAGTNEYRCRKSVLRIKKTENGYALTSSDGNAIINEFKYNQATDRLVSFHRLSDSLGKNELARRMYLEISGSNAVTTLYSSQYSLVKNEGDECFKGQGEEAMSLDLQPVSVDLVLCQTSFGYRLEIQEHDGEQFFSYPFVYDEESEKYLVDFQIKFYSIEEETDDKLSIEDYYVVDYSPEFGHYYLSIGTGNQRAIQVTRDKILAAEFLFRDKADNIVPEEIVNPQTSDAILKSLAIIVFSITPIAIVRKQLSKR